MATEKSQPFETVRETLGAGSPLTPVYAPRPSRKVTIQNGTTGDLQVHSSEDEADNAYFVIAAGWEREIPVDFRHLAPAKAFWLKALNGGLVVMIWQ